MRMSKVTSERPRAPTDSSNSSDYESNLTCNMKAVRSRN